MINSARIDEFSFWKRFFSAYFFALIINLPWSISLLLNGAWSGYLSQSLSWLKNHMTYGLFHHIFLPIAIGMFFAVAKKEVFLTAKKHMKVTLGVFICLAILLTIDDSHGENRTFQPYELDPIRGRLCLENALRTDWEQYRPANNIALAPPERIASFAAEAAKCRESAGSIPVDIKGAAEYYEGKVNLGFLKTWGKLNWTGRFAILSTWLTITFSLVFIWYCAALAVGKNGDTWRTELAFILLLMSFWVPCRIYTNWYQTYFIPTGDSETNYTAALAGIAVGSLFLFLLTLAMRKHQKIKDMILIILGTGVGAITFTFHRFPETFQSIKNVVASASWVQLITIYLVAVFLMLSAVASIKAREE